MSAAFAQNQEDDYRKVDYLKVEQSQLEKFVQVMEKDMIAGFEDLLGTDGIKSWYLYKVKYPGGNTSEYNLVSITTSSSMESLGDHFSDTVTPGFIPSTIGDNVERQLSKLASLVKSEIWKIENSAFADTGASPSRYMTMDFMNVAQGRDLDYLMLEDEIAKPIHLERMERDRMEGWEVYSLILPSGVKYPYNFATGNYFDKLEHFEFGFNEEIIRHTMGPNSNVPELFNTINNTRDMVHVELWELIDHRKVDE
ncbi:MAG: hypothetical protein ACQEST_07560 [Bacteroidota bacterium]